MLESTAESREEEQEHGCKGGRLARQGGTLNGGGNWKVTKDPNGNKEPSLGGDKWPEEVIGVARPETIGDHNLGGVEEAPNLFPPSRSGIKA